MATSTHPNALLNGVLRLPSSPELTAAFLAPLAGTSLATDTASAMGRHWKPLLNALHQAVSCPAGIAYLAGRPTLKRQLECHFRVVSQFESLKS